jgi:hypothetical protein
MMAATILPATFAGDPPVGRRGDCPAIGPRCEAGLSVRRSDVDQPDLSSVHQTWILRSAEVLLLDDGLLVAAGFGDLATRPPDHVCFAAGVHMRFGLPRELRTG